MNFAPFGVPLSAALPVATQFSAGKITQSVTTPSGQVVGVLQGGENGVHYIRPFDASAFAQTHQAPGSPTGAQQGQTVISLPITMPGAKPGDPQQTVQIQVVNPAQQNEGNSPKYQLSQIPIQTFGQGATVLTVAYSGNQEGLQILDGQSGLEGMTVVAAIQPQDIQIIQAQLEQQQQQQQQQQVQEQKEENDKAGDTQLRCKDGAEVQQQTNEPEAIHVPAQYLQNMNTLQEYLQKVQTAQPLPLTSLHQFLKFNGAPEIKRELITEDGVLEAVSIANPEEQEQLIMNSVTTEMATQEDGQEDPNEKGKKKKKSKKKPPKPKKPKPGQVHIATALDGTTLFCCPECHMAYPEKELLEQHLVGHKIERRFICDICGAGLKRKEHLERHKLGHNPERPFVCSVCMKGFKRKEHLNLHFVIHSGEKTEICGECGKGFYRKDHLRKHLRSHITRRAKEQAEMAQAILKAGGTQEDVENELNNMSNGIAHAQVTIEVGTGGPNGQIQIPVQIQVPQHTIQLSNTDEDGQQQQQASTVVLPAAPESISILPN
ncbi:zinc finger and BTB domain-containing protein 49-like isoform X2 [Anthonomus grandis grandis]|uniref:zinc finger and BTB domain-containing protein 49-like isoform X2 n=1 Tax=Anthonomus grandis grandis TaxID=2921223 RepID=UPI0021656F69|nr:zinc finger and BTB domain-containing protein 49-like isoform X2 [Anthonomus grandis grandis]